MRKYLPTLAELVDRLVITQSKEILIHEHRDEYSAEINDIVHDIQEILTEKQVVLNANAIRDIIVNALFNSWIWQNEAKARRGEEGSDLKLTHGLNSIRNTAKNKIQENVGGRKDYKLDNVEAYQEWVPSGY